MVQYFDIWYPTDNLHHLYKSYLLRLRKTLSLPSMEIIEMWVWCHRSYKRDEISLYQCHDLYGDYCIILLLRGRSLFGILNRVFIAQKLKIYRGMWIIYIRPAQLANSVWELAIKCMEISVYHEMPTVLVLLINICAAWSAVLKVTLLLIWWYMFCYFCGMVFWSLLIGLFYLGHNIHTCIIMYFPVYL